MQDLKAIFGTQVFNDEAMKERLPKDVYKALQKTISEGKHLQMDVANVRSHTKKREEHMIPSRPGLPTICTEVNP